MTEQLLRALQESEPEAVLRLVDRLFREGRHLQHFCGELTRQFRNLLVMKVSGTATTLVTAGAEERSRLAAWVEVFSLEDLTRYLNLLLDLYRDLQHTPQPRFRFEIGLLKLVYAGRLQPIEKILAEWNGGSAGPAPESPNRRAGDGSWQAAGTQANATTTSEPKAFAAAVGIPIAESAPPVRPLAAPEPSTDRPSAPAADTPSLPPASQAPAAVAVSEERETNGANGLQNGELKQKLVQALRRQGDESVADAVDHGTVTSFANKVEIRSLADYQTSLEFSLSVLEDAVAETVGRRVRVLLGDVLESPPQGPAARSNTNTGADSVMAAEGDAAQRALADPEVQKIQQLFGGRVREVRNLRGYSL
jgi:DNA polymerase-3 subunit gamma/tau